MSNYIDNEARANFYFGEYPEFEKQRMVELAANAPSDYLPDKELLYKFEKYLNSGGGNKNYYEVMDEFISTIGAQEKSFVVRLGDSQTKMDLPIFVKTRKAGNKNGIILPFNSARHWRYRDHLRFDSDWKMKSDNVIWRGMPTGRRKHINPRVDLVKKFGQELNVGLIRSGNENLNTGIPKNYFKGYLSIDEHLGRKYILSIEGNDVATNLKWIMASNSLPLIPSITIDSWLMESKLIPFHHFVPVAEDFSDLLDVLEWCRANDDACEQIAMNGKEYMEQFTDESRDEIYKMLFSKYRDLFNGDITL